MRKLSTAFGIAAVFATMAFAEDFTGRLIDASCSAEKQAQQNACAPTGSTTSFAVMTAGKVYKLDDSGNAKATEALKSRADRAANPGSAEANNVNVKISGTKEGDVIKVDTLQVQ